MAILLIVLRLSWLLAILCPMFCRSDEHSNWRNHSPLVIPKVYGDSNAYRSSKDDTYRIQKKISEIFNVPAFSDGSFFGQKNPFDDNNSHNSASDIFHPKLSEVINANKNRSDKMRTFVADRRNCLEPGKSLCAEVRNYPDIDQIESMLMRQLPNVQVFLDEDTTASPNISQRMNIYPYEEGFCFSREKIIYPKLGETVNSSWFFILNSPKYKQGIRVEECEQDGGKCKAFVTLPNKYVASCKQQYVYRSLVALTSDGKITSDQFKIPSCCKCMATVE